MTDGIREAHYTNIVSNIMPTMIIVTFILNLTTLYDKALLKARLGT